MKRAGNLWPQVTSWENLLASALAAARGKRKRPDVARFLFNLEPNLCALQRELLDGTWRPGEYRTFWIRDPKPRMISAAPFRDRVVHHAVTRVLESVFEPRFTASSFASRKGFGQHQALRKARAACARYKYVLKCDVRKYFPSMDHLILKELLARAIKCKPTLELVSAIVDGSNAQEEVSAVFPGDTLFTRLERRKGLPIGNQTSQFFANVYLNALDHFVLRELRPALYLRYVDDFAIFGDDKAELARMRRAIVARLEQLRLELHEGKSRVYRCADGVTFLGWRLFPGRARLPRRNVVRMRRRLRAIRERFHRAELDLADVRRRISAWLGHAAFGDTWKLRRKLFAGFILVGAERRRNSWGFLEQQYQERPRLEP
ncbi:MAG: reverse transcriptase/maturase family protein [Bryobacteraceae bacterium]|jgi:retron-type reverse transcriptase